MSKSTVLSQPFKIKEKVILNNRIVKSALSEVLADSDGSPLISHVNLYRRWVQGGAALLITGNIMVDRKYIGEPNNVILDEQSNLDYFKKWTSVIKGTKCHLWAQLNHPGKQSPSFITWEPVAPSAIALKGGLRAGFNKPRALRDDEIIKIIQKFAISAQLAKQTGFTGVQIHAAHGYLINQFLSPLHNQRTDRWGGNLENRMRFLVQVYHSIREEVGQDFPIAIKLNTADFQRGGFTEDEFLIVVEKLAKIGVDLIEISGGTYESQTMTGINHKPSDINRESYFLEYAEKIRKLVDTPLMVTGGFRSVKCMTEAIEENKTDLIGLGRPFAIDPDIPKKILANPDYKVEVRDLTTGIKKIDQLTLINITWYEHQLWRMAHNQPTEPNLSPWISIFKTMKNAGIYNFKKRRN